MSHTSDPCRTARNIRYCSSIVLPDPGVPAHSTEGGRAERQASGRSNRTGSPAAPSVFAITGPAGGGADGERDGGPQHARSLGSGEAGLKLARQLRALVRLCARAVVAVALLLEDVVGVHE